MKLAQVGPISIIIIKYIKIGQGVGPCVKCFFFIIVTILDADSHPILKSPLRKWDKYVVKNLCDRK